MTDEFVIAGFGGQGVLFMGKVLAYAGLCAGKEVSWLPSYGPEMRGGTANCHVILSEHPVASPLIIHPTTLFAMNLPSLKKFEEAVTEGGTIVFDHTMIEEKNIARRDVRLISVPAAQWAEEMNAARLANMILLGAFARESGRMTLDELLEGLKKSVPKTKAELFELNRKAILRGYEK